MSILITGGTKGIGLAVAKAFARESGEVFLNYHSDDAAARASNRRLRPRRKISI
jgi:enoyl-[acyl-carrier protein] reductase III